jgi:hypothetical protein
MRELRSDRAGERAKIAVLDTGIDINHLLFRDFRNKQILEENSLDFTVDPPEQLLSDNTGHGTHCTHLILKTCITAEIYTAKVFKKAKADQDTANCVARVTTSQIRSFAVMF